MLSRQTKERLQTNPAQFIEQEIKEFVRTSPLNRMPITDNHIIFDEPLVQFADGDDPLFAEYKTIIASIHLRYYSTLRPPSFQSAVILFSFTV